MLTHLIIKNYVLIKHLEMSPTAHLNVITGETGAGKSIMLGAIGLLLGNRADSKALWSEDEKCITEGTFNIASYHLKELFESEDLDYSDTTTLRREISPGGKSRAFINDTPVTLEVMRKIGNRLMDVHSQHETLELASKGFQLEVIDSYAENSGLKKTYQQLWKSFQLAQKEYDSLLEEATALKKESDFVNFQLKELTGANLVEGELEELEATLKILEHAEEIKSHFNSIIDQLGRSEYSVESTLSSIRGQFQQIASYSQLYEKLQQRFESARIELRDIQEELESAEEKIEYDPIRAEQIKERVGLIYQLLQKHRLQSVKELISLRDELQEKSTKTHNLDQLLNDARQRRDNLEKEVLDCAQKLSASRKKIFVALTTQLTSLLKELGIPEAQLSIDQSTVAPLATGIDSIEILFSANKGVLPRPLAQVASGGEFSRLMFSIKYVMAEKTLLPTLILDEIDSGISGEIAIRLGKRMKEMATRHQLISISHLPQIASQADGHFYVYKDNSKERTITNMRRLTQEERVSEIAQMIGGANPSEKARESALEMLSS